MDYPFYKVANILSFLERNNVSVQKKFGQNFLIDQNILSIFERKFLEVDKNSFELIAEIGAGLGFLTHLLYKESKTLALFEIDQFFVKYLSKKYPNALLYEGCITKNYDKLKDKSVFIFGNLPYYLTSTILVLIISNLKRLRGAFFLVQKEVGEKLLSKKSSLSIFLNAYGNFKIIKNVSKHSFFPKPKVDSVILSYTPNPKLNSSLEFEVLETICKIFFWGKRKKVSNCIKNAPYFSHLDNFRFRDTIQSFEKELSISFDSRPEEIFFEIYYNLAKKVTSSISK